MEIIHEISEHKKASKKHPVKPGHKRVMCAVREYPDGPIVTKHIDIKK